ncbi:alpha/beta fold hydrolase [Nocardia yunnanensis]|uniref:Alpha/beta fold hydrolase n=1 Tax=Nocardia yunnanensis TaxID=2382165 RepID=A0A386ZLR6_9NOCA|nr:alpha/beta fold hydrolase [Nocardia yunnanensis]AYF78378.1 alpha/beta fold hydrolase [Nocardia yunnanensis]
MDAIVFGATGFIGRSLVAELLGRGQRVAAAVRTDTLTPWLLARGVDIAGLTVVTADITRPLADLPEARDVYNTAARYAFGLGEREARATNVIGATNVLEWAANLPALRRLVHVSGYRVSAPSGTPDYAALGAYEASKFEGDLAVRALAKERGAPLTIANPSTVIGPGQYIGLAGLVRNLWEGRLPAIPGGPEVFVPIVTIDYFARFLASIPESPAGEHYWVLDDATPPLPELIRTVADHLGVPGPRRSIPVGLLRRLPRALTGADPETLSFLSTDRYPTAAAHSFAAAAGLEMPPAEDALRVWADDLVAERFGTAAPGLRPYGFHSVAGSRTWITGDRHTPEYVLLHGLPMNAEVWTPLAGRLRGPVLAPDLPGLGRSAPSDRPLEEWLADLMSPVRTRPVLVAHSLACGPAMRYAAAHPDRIAKLVLIAPALLQAPGPRSARSAPAAAMLRRLSVQRLADTLHLPSGPEIESAAADLRRPGVARRVVRALRTVHAERGSGRELLDRVRVPLEIVVGSADPLAVPVDQRVIVLPGAGHYPQLTHPAELAEQLESLSDPLRR